MYPGAPTRRAPVPRILWSASIPATSADTRSVRSISSGRSSPHALRSSGTCASLSRPASRTTRPFSPWATPIQQSTATCTEARAAPGHSDELPLRTRRAARPITAGCDALSTPCTSKCRRVGYPGRVGRADRTRQKFGLKAEYQYDQPIDRTTPTSLRAASGSGGALSNVSKTWRPTKKSFTSSRLTAPSACSR